MTQSSNKDAFNPREWLKMKDLASKSGIPKSTILYYINEGLLPSPVKTSPNMAYYNPLCLERLRFIKEVQTRHSLPLKAIKGLIKELDRGREATPLLELQEILFGKPDHYSVNAKDFRKATGLNAKQMKRAEASGVITPIEDGRYDQKDIEIGKLVKKSIELGIEPEEWSIISELGQPLADVALSLRYEHTRDLPHDEDARLTGEIALLYREFMPYIIDRIISRRLILLKGLKDPTLRPDEELDNNKKHAPNGPAANGDSK